MNKKSFSSHGFAKACSAEPVIHGQRHCRRNSRYAETHQRPAQLTNIYKRHHVLNQGIFAGGVSDNMPSAFLGSLAVARASHALLKALAVFLGQFHRRQPLHIGRLLPPCPPDNAPSIQSTWICSLPNPSQLMVAACPSTAAPPPRDTPDYDAAVSFISFITASSISAPCVRTSGQAHTGFTGFG